VGLTRQDAAAQHNAEPPIFSRAEEFQQMDPQSQNWFYFQIFDLFY
jgi:hypothetical protein